MTDKLPPDPASQPLALPPNADASVVDLLAEPAAGPWYRRPWLWGAVAAVLLAGGGLWWWLDNRAANAAPSARVWQQRWEAAVAALGLPVFCLPSGAGHDAMKLHELMPQAMLFVRGGNAGISHNPLETITADDAELCVAAFTHLLESLASA